MEDSQLQSSLFCYQLSTIFMLLHEAIRPPFSSVHFFVRNENFVQALLENKKQVNVNNQQVLIIFCSFALFPLLA